MAKRYNYRLRLVASSPRNKRLEETIENASNTGSGNGGNIAHGGEMPDVYIQQGENIEISTELAGGGKTYTISHGGKSSAEESHNGDASVVQNIKKDKFGHVLGFTSKDLFPFLCEKLLRKDADDSTAYLLRFLAGAEFGKYAEKITGGKITPDGVADLLSAIVRSDLTSADFVPGMLGSGFQIKTDRATGKSYAEIDELSVRMKAIFSELEIRKATYSGGTLFLSPAGAKCTRVEEHDGFYRCFFHADDGDKVVRNEFRMYDQVRSQEFNVAVANKYYWRLCVATGDDYIDLSKSDCDAGSGVPAPGDDMVALGNRKDVERQNAIVISAYGEGSPSITQHAGINTYSLKGTERTRISPEKNVFTGELRVETGETIQDFTKKEIDSVKIGSRNLLRLSKKVVQAENEQAVEHDISCFGTGVWRFDKLWRHTDIWRMSNIYLLGNEYNHYVFTPTVALRPNSSYYLSIGAAVALMGDVMEYTVAIYDKTLGVERFKTLVAVSAERTVVRIDMPAAVVPENENVVLFYTGVAGMAEDRSVVWHEVKLEEGTKATDWTPAPEDDTDAIDGVLKEIQDIHAFEDAVNKSIEDIKNSIDGSIETWFYEPEPTMSNPPVSTWKKEEYHSHIGDLYYSGAGLSYRFLETTPGVYEWKPITDDAISEALRLAKEAKDTADHKRRVFIGEAVPTVPYDKGDLWVNAVYKDASHNYDNDLLRCTVDKATGVFSITDWTYATKYTDDTKADTALSEVAKANKALTEANRRLDEAESSAAVMKTEISDIVSDKKLTPSEKQVMLKEWNTIKAEYVVNLALAKDQYKVPFEDYRTAYNNLSSYIDSMKIFDAATMGMTTDVNEAEFYARFVAYYDARTVLLDSISKEAKRLADDAHAHAEEAWNHADDAITAAANAQGAADAANQRLEDWSADSVISPAEKQGIKDELARILADKKDIADGYTRYVLGTADDYNLKYAAYKEQLDALCVTTQEVIPIPETFAAVQAAYYNARTAALTKIAEAAKQFVIDKDAERQEDIRQINVKFEQTDQSISGIVTSIGKQDAKIDDAVDKAGRAETAAAGAETKAGNAEQAAGDSAASAEAAAGAAASAKSSAGASAGSAAAAEAKAKEAAASGAAAVRAAEDAEKAASAASASAKTATDTLLKAEDDGLVSPVEKKALIQQMNDIRSEYNAVIKDAERYTIDTDSYTRAYNLAMLALEKYTKPTPTYIPLDKQLNDFGNIAKYYEARQLILDLIAAATKDYTTTRFDITDGKIEGNIRATEMLSDRVSTAESDIRQTKDEIATKVSQTSFDELSGTVALQESRIEQNAQSISLKVSASEAKDIASEESKKAVDSVQVGVRNLIPHSESLHQDWNNDFDREHLLSCFSSGVWLMDNYIHWLNDTKWKNDNIGYYGAENNHFESWITEGILPETPYTLSVGSSSTDGVGCRFYNFALYDYERSLVLYMGVLPVSTSRVSATFITPSTINKDHKTQLLLYTGFAGSADHNAMTWEKVKLEQGNKATDWSPSPEEVDDAIRKNAEKIASWAADGVFSPTERKGLGEEIERVKKDSNHLLVTYGRYGFTQDEINSLRTICVEYLNQLEHYYAIKGDKAVKIEAGFNEARVAYYAAIQEAWDAIDKKSKDSTDANKATIDSWAEDGKFSPTERKGLKDEIVKIDKDKTHIDASYKEYGIIDVNNVFLKAYNAYRAELDKYSKIAGSESVVIAASFNTALDNYYAAKSNALAAIDAAAKALSDDVKQGLLETGIDIKNKEITVTADNFLVRTNSGKAGLQVFADDNGTPKLQAEYINADGIKAKNIDVSGDITANTLTLAENTAPEGTPINGTLLQEGSYVMPGLKDGEFRVIYYIQPLVTRRVYTLYLRGANSKVKIVLNGDLTTSTYDNVAIEGAASYLLFGSNTYGYTHWCVYDLGTHSNIQPQ